MDLSPFHLNVMPVSRSTTISSSIVAGTFCLLSGSHHLWDIGGSCCRVRVVNVVRMVFSIALVVSTSATVIHFLRDAVRFQFRSPNSSLALLQPRLCRAAEATRRSAVPTQTTMLSLKDVLGRHGMFVLEDQSQFIRLQQSDDETIAEVLAPLGPARSSKNTINAGLRDRATAVPILSS